MTLNRELDQVREQQTARNTERDAQQVALQAEQAKMRALLQHQMRRQVYNFTIATMNRIHEHNSIYSS